MKIVIVGGGKLGFYLAKTLLEHHHEPTVIESDVATCAEVSESLEIPVVCGDGTTIEALKAAGAGEADALVAVTGKDEQNLVTCQLAKMMFPIGRTAAKVNNPKNADIMRKLGIDIVVSSTDTIARLIEWEVDFSGLKHIATLGQGEATLHEIVLPSDYALSGRKLSDIRPPEQSVIVAVERRHEMIIPRGNTEIMAGDKLIVLVKGDGLDAVYKKLKL
jgi:trk system potassium uptake protein TrkA